MSSRAPFPRRASAGARRGGSAPAAGDQADSIAIRDERGERAAVAWLAAIARRLERYEADRLPFAVLLVELREIERLRPRGPRPRSSRRWAPSSSRCWTGELYGTGGIRGADEPRTAALDGVAGATQRPGRCWLRARHRPARARALADRLVRAVLAEVSHRGRPLEALVGIAVCPGRAPGCGAGRMPTSTCTPRARPGPASSPPRPASARRRPARDPATAAAGEPAEGRDVGALPTTRVPIRNRVRDPGRWRRRR